MKIQCDVCNKDSASVFCTADEAALCDACDHRVHHANKLAEKHQRFSLLHPSPKEVPLCDICQERRGFLFCQQDRAILCKDCDIPIHKANEHTKNHNRFLLTGIKLSATSALYSSSSPSSSSAAAAQSLTNGSDAVPNLKCQNSIIKPICLSSPISNPTSMVKTATIETVAAASDEKGGGINQLIDGGGNGDTSSIAEYLIEMLPGWQVEDFLDSSSSPCGFSKNMDDDVLPFWDANLQNNLSSLSPENMGIWVPQAPQILQTSQSFLSSNMVLGGQICFKQSKDAAHIKSNRKWSTEDNCFTVPQITPPSIAPKRARTFW